VIEVTRYLEPGPRGWYTGGLGIVSGPLVDVNILIRTAAFERRDECWTFRTLAGAGIVADSDPQSELAETETKIAALRQALTGQQSVQAICVTSRGFR